MTSVEAAPTFDLDEFRLVRVLGRGGMGAVYLGYDTVLERDVAIKVMRERTNDEDARVRFLTEARAIARLDHPNVIAIFRAATTHDGHPYLVQELVRGSSLDRIPLPIEPRRVVEIALGIARGLAAAHRRGILHRDIKPANVMIDEAGTPKLLDFGVAKLTRSETRPGVVDRAELALDRTKSLRPGPGLEVAATLDPVRVASPDVVSPDVAATDHDARPPASYETEAGTVIGTPRYMAPETWLGEPATARSDIYSFGVLLYELAAGMPPFPARERLALAAEVVDGGPAPSIASLVPALDPELAEIITGCLARDAAQRPESADEIVHRIERILVGAPPVPEGNPYPGLAPFAADHRAVFYGRGTDISTVVDRLRSDPLVVVAGDSGIGKSSLCRAGVIPAVVAGGLGDARAWRARTITVGRHAVSALREELALRGAPDLSVTEVARAAGASAESGTVIFLDQFEELITLNDPAEAIEAANLIADLSRGVPGVKVLIALRGDFLTRVAALPGLGPLLTRSLHLLRVLSLADARDAVVGPARAKGVRFETPALVEALASSVADQPGSLPLLSFALAELWQRRDVDRAVIPAAALDAIGGVAGGLARHADSVIGALSKPERAAVRRIALHLVTREGTRDDRTRGELCPDDDPAATAALEAMIRGRLVVARNTATGEPSYELAHDSLIAAWSTLRGWRDDVAGQRGLRTRLAAAADEWRRLGRRADALWNRAQLAEVAGLDELSDGDRAFVAASHRAARRRRAVRLVLGASLPAVAISTWLVIQRQTGAARDREVAKRVETALSHVHNAELARDAANRDRAEAFRLFDLGTAEATATAEATWERVHGSEATAHLSYAAATSELEGALSIDGSRRDVRARMAHALFDRALLAEVERDQVTANETAARLGVFDDDGALVSAWRQPAELTLEAPGASRIELRRYEARHRQLELGEPIASTTTPRLVRDLDPGSYLVEIVGGDGIVVRYPVLVGRAERLAIAIAIPRAADVPEGMVFVAPGRFLSGGSTSDEVVRKGFLGTTPLHVVVTGAYLIARTEVTFADWMVYLRALPPAEREQRRPRVSASTGTFTVLGGGTRDDDPFVLTFQATTTPVVARQGEPLVFPDRDRRRNVRWEAMPVSGVSYRDAEAYAAWLSSTGRVRGARVCGDAEWERGARGADGRTWAHGDWIDDTATDDANIDATYGRKTLAYGPDEVGVHPRSTSPFGLVDTVGNVWEWVSGTEGHVVLRGGGWYQGIASAIVTNRDLNDPTARQWWAGVRICANAP